MTIGILKINLFYAVNPDGRGLGGTGPVGIFNMVLIAVVDAQSKSKTDTREEMKKSKWWKRSEKTMA